MTWIPARLCRDDIGLNYKMIDQTAKFIVQEHEPKEAPTAGQVHIFRFQLPATLGSDVAGVVLEVGNRVTRFKPGAEVLASVFGMGTGSLAEFAVVPENSLACGSTPPSPATWSPTWRTSRRAPSKAFLDSHQGENW